MRFIHVTLLSALSLAAFPAGAQTPSIYAMAGAASVHFDRCGAPEIGTRVRQVLEALAEECRVTEGLRAEFRAVLAPALAAAREEAESAEGMSCRAMLRTDASMPAFLERLRKFDAGEMKASQALPLACDRLNVVLR